MNTFTEEEYRTMAEVMMLGLKHVKPEDRVTAGFLINDLVRISNGQGRAPAGQGVLTDEEVKNCPTFDEVLNNMKQHVLSSGQPVDLMPADEPLALKFGWVDDGSEKAWTVRVAEFKKWADTLGSAKAELTRKAITTHEGKMNFAKALSEQVNSVLK